METPKKRLFFSTMSFMNYVFSKGKLAVFRHHRYATADESEIEQLLAEVKAGHPNIYVKAGEEYLTAEMEDPMKALKAKIIADYLAEQAKHVNPMNDMGKTVQEPIRPQSTSDIASVAAGGDATQLVALANKMASGAKKAS